MVFSLKQLIASGYDVPAAPLDDWRTYDEDNPVPGYFDFDWFSSRHPDLYHKYALTSTGLMQELDGLLDLSGMHVLDMGSGTGCASLEAAKKARRVTGVDIFTSVVPYGRAVLREAGMTNVDFLRGDCNHLPLPENTFDACLSSWAIWSSWEAYRVLKPGGVIISLGPVPGSLCGELTGTLASAFPEVITEVAAPELFDPDCPAVDSLIQDEEWSGLPVIPPVRQHDFTYLSDYGQVSEAAAITGRLYGPPAKCYFLERNQPTFAWRLRIEIARVRK
jgi:SAM-dependent methyltransferase